MDYKTEVYKLARNYRISVTLTEDSDGDYCVEINTMRTFYNLDLEHFLCMDQDNVELLKDGEQKVTLESTWEAAYDLLTSGLMECDQDCEECAW